MGRGKGHGWLWREDTEVRICKPGKGELKQSTEIMLGTWSLVRLTGPSKEAASIELFCVLSDVLW